MPVNSNSRFSLFYGPRPKVGGNPGRACSQHIRQAEILAWPISCIWPVAEHPWPQQSEGWIYPGKQLALRFLFLPVTGYKFKAAYGQTEATYSSSATDGQVRSGYCWRPSLVLKSKFRIAEKYSTVTWNIC